MIEMLQKTSSTSFPPSLFPLSLPLSSVRPLYPLVLPGKRREKVFRLGRRRSWQPLLSPSPPPPSLQSEWRKDLWSPVLPPSLPRFLPAPHIHVSRYEPRGGVCVGGKEGAGPPPLSPPPLPFAALPHPDRDEDDGPSDRPSFPTLFSTQGCTERGSRRRRLRGRDSDSLSPLGRSQGNCGSEERREKAKAASTHGEKGEGEISRWQQQWDRRRREGGGDLGRSEGRGRA